MRSPGRARAWRSSSSLAPFQRTASRQGSQADNVTSTLFATPAQRPIRFMDPGVLAGHSRGARRRKSDKGKSPADHAVDQVIMDRKQRAIEQCEMNKANGGAEHQGIDDYLPPRPPGQGHRTPRQSRRATAEKDGHQYKYA